MFVTLVLILVGLIAAGVFFRKPHWGLAALVYLLPFERIGLIAINAATSVRPSQIAGIALIAAYGARLAFRKEKPSITPAFYWLAGLAAWALVPVIAVQYSPLVRNYLLGLLVMVLCFCVAQVAARGNQRTIIAALCASAIFVSLYALYQFAGDILGAPQSLTGLIDGYTKQAFGFPRVHSTAFEPQFFANYLLVPFAISLALVLTNSLKKKWPVALYFLFALTLFLTTSRMALVAALVITGIELTLLWFARANREQLMGSVVLTLFVPGLVAFAALGIASHLRTGNFLFAPQLLLKQSTSNLTNTGSFTERSESAHQAIELIKQQPIIGYGIGGYTFKVKNYPLDAPQERVVVNNETLELAAETGLVGLMLALGFAFVLISSAYRAWNEATGTHKALLLGLMAGVIGIGIQQQTFSGFYITHIWVYAGLLAGFAIIPKRASQ